MTLEAVGEGPRFRVNVAASFAYLAVNTLVALWFIPYLIRNLGVAAYGMVPLAISITWYLNVFTIAIGGSVGRFLTMDLERGDLAAASRTFNTTLFASAALVGFLLVPAGAGIVLAPRLLSVPEGMEGAMRALLLWGLAAFFVMTIGNSFGAAAFARRRFDMQNGANAAGVLAKACIAAALFSLLVPRPWQAGAAIFGGQVVTVAGGILIFRRLCPEIRVRWSDFDADHLRAILTMGGWMLVSQVGAVLITSTELLIVNVMAGSSATGYYAPVLQLAVLLRMAVGLVAGVLSPVIIGFHARADSEGLLAVSYRSVKLLGLAAALPVGLLCGLAGPLLRTWLGAEFEGFAPLVWVMIAPLAVSLASAPLASVNTALNRVRLPGLATLAGGVLNVALAVVLAGPAGLGMYGVAAARSVVVTLRNAVFAPLYTASTLRRPLLTFAPPLALPLAAALLAAGIAAAAWRLAGVTGWAGLFLCGAVTTALYVPAVLFAALGREERRFAVRVALGEKAMRALLGRGPGPGGAYPPEAERKG